MTGGNLVKAFLYDDDHGQQVLTCLFNPTEYSLSKSNQWDAKALKGDNVPRPDFQGGGIMTMQFQLFFDTYADGTDVRDYTNKLLDLMKFDANLTNSPSDQSAPDGSSGGGSSGGHGAHKGRPPICSFHWGEQWSFQGVIKSVKLKFTLFTAQGIPVRATADLDMQQAYDQGQYPRQNPTSGGQDVQASRVVQPGDTLDLIAYREYGNATLWRHLADANGLENPRALYPGQRLIVPAL